MNNYTKGLEAVHKESSVQAFVQRWNFLLTQAHKYLLNLKQINLPFFLSYRTSFSQGKATVVQFIGKSWDCTVPRHRLPRGKEEENTQLFTWAYTVCLLRACSSGTAGQFGTAPWALPISALQRRYGSPSVITWQLLFTKASRQIDAILIGMCSAIQETWIRAGSQAWVTSSLEQQPDHPSLRFPQSTYCILTKLKKNLMNC